MREHIEEECNIRCKDQSALNIVWQHSRLREQTDDAPLILSVGMDITARKKAEMRLAWLADHDSLTGLYNRRRFTRELNDAVAAARRYRRTGALLFLDLDQFLSLIHICCAQLGIVWFFLEQGKNLSY